DVNFFDAWNATAAAMPELVAAGGHVVNVLSGLAVVDFPFAAAYSASKRALEAYSNALRIEYAGRVTVTALYPGYVRTAIHRRGAGAWPGRSPGGGPRPPSAARARAGRAGRRGGGGRGSSCGWPATGHGWSSEWSGPDCARRGTGGRRRASCAIRRDGADESRP